MRAVDTNVVLRMIVRDDESQADTADAFTENGCWVPLLAVAETVWALRKVYKQSAEQIAAAVGMLLDKKDLLLQDADVIEAALAQFQSHPGVGFADCLMLESARKAGHLPIGTFDRRLGALEGAHRL